MSGAIKTSFGSKLRALMAARGLTVRQTASAIGISASTLQNWRSGDNQPSTIEPIARLAKLFKVEFCWLATGEKESHAGIFK